MTDDKFAAKARELIQPLLCIENESTCHVEEAETAIAEALQAAADEARKEGNPAFRFARSKESLEIATRLWEASHFTFRTQDVKAFALALDAFAAKAVAAEREACATKIESWLEGDLGKAVANSIRALGVE